MLVTDEKIGLSQDFKFQHIPTRASQNQKEPGPLIARIKQISLMTNSRNLNN